MQCIGRVVVAQRDNFNPNAHTCSGWADLGNFFTILLLNDNFGVEKMTRINALVCFSLISVHVAVSAGASALVVQHPDTNIESDLPCRYPEETSPPWYRLETPDFAVNVLSRKEINGSGSVAGLVSFRLEYKGEVDGETRAPVLVQRTHFGPVFSMAVTESLFVATGCSDSHTDYLYIADLDSPAQGMGISCVSPGISPTGKYVFFRALSARRGDPAPCCLIIDLLDLELTPHRVYPLHAGLSEEAPLVLKDAEQRWFWPPWDTIYDCRDDQGHAHRPISPAVWSDTGDKIAFVDQVTGNSANISTRHEFVVLNFRNGIVLPEVIVLPLDYARIMDPERASRPHMSPTARIHWVDENVLEVTFTGEPGLLNRNRFQLFLTDELCMEGSSFFDYATFVNGQREARDPGSESR